MSEDTMMEEITASMIRRHPDWEGQEWIDKGVRCLCAEHTAERSVTYSGKGGQPKKSVDSRCFRRCIHLNQRFTLL
jgi:hypothetical protein